MQADKRNLFFVFDVESVGLHGPAFAVGYTVVDLAGNEVTWGRHVWQWARSIDVHVATVDYEDMAWCRAHIPAMPVDCQEPKDLRDKFWAAWERFRERAWMVVDCGWPVEAKFLEECVRDDPVARKWLGPYPLLDIAPIAAALGQDPTEPALRKPTEFPIHDPLADARQTARLWVEALGILASAQPRPTYFPLPPIKRPER